MENYIHNSYIYIVNRRKFREHMKEELLDYKPSNLYDMHYDKVARKFLNLYEKQLHYTFKEDIIDFYNKTGLYLTHLVETPTTKIAFDITGAFVFYDLYNKIHKLPKAQKYEILYYKDEEGEYKALKQRKMGAAKVSNFNVITTTYVDSIEEKEDGIYITTDDSQELIYKYENDIKEKKEEMNKMDFIRELLLTSPSIRNKIDVIKEEFDENAFDFIDTSRIIQIELIYPFNKLYVLTDDKNLYEDKKLYATNVIRLWRLNKYSCKIIYDNNDLEDLTFTYFPIDSKYVCYKNINYRDNYLLTEDFRGNVSIIEKYDEYDETSPLIETTYKNIEKVEKDDKNNIYITCLGYKTAVISRLSTRTINDYYWGDVYE